MTSFSSISCLFRGKKFKKRMVFIVNDIVPQFLISFLDDVMYRYIFRSISKSRWRQRFQNLASSIVYLQKCLKTKKIHHQGRPTNFGRPKHLRFKFLPFKTGREAGDRAPEPRGQLPPCPSLTEATWQLALYLRIDIECILPV